MSIVPLSSLAAVFQLTAGVAFAMSVFRVPHEQTYQRLGAILVEEEALMFGRTDEAARAQELLIGSARTKWLLAGPELRKDVEQWEKLIWVSVVYASLMLIGSSLFPAITFPWPIGIALLAPAILPAIIAVAMIRRSQALHLDPVSAEIHRL